MGSGLQMSLDNPTRPRTPRCNQLTKLGVPCPGPAVMNGLCIGHHRASLPPEERSRLSREAGLIAADAAPRRMLRSASQVLTYCEETANDVTSATTDVAKARMAICAVVLKCLELIRQEKAEEEKKKADGFAFGAQKVAG